MLVSNAISLLTLTGPGGSGKTRLGLQLAWDVVDQFAGGVVFVALAALRDGALVKETIAQACGVQPASLEALVAFLRDKRVLLLLDSCEHLTGLAPVLAELQAIAPGLVVLATSRAPLSRADEQTLSVPPLALPDMHRLPPLAALAALPSVALLVERTQALNPRFALTLQNAHTVAAICVRLDGLPLAIELAAARLRLLSPRDLLRRLDRALALLTGGPRDLPDRQQTLRATIDWSYRLLGTAEQWLFDCLAVFSGGWSLKAAETVCAAPGSMLVVGSDLPVREGLAALVDKSLVQHQAGDDGTARFSMLETIREFAAERLQQRGTGATMAQAHAVYVAAWAEALDHNAPGWIATIAGELDNVRAALRWSLDDPARVDVGLRLGVVVARFWYWRDWLTEGRWWLEQLLACSDDRRTEARVYALAWTAVIATAQGDEARVRAARSDAAAEQGAAAAPAARMR